MPAPLTLAKMLSRHRPVMRDNNVMLAVIKVDLSSLRDISSLLTVVIARIAAHRTEREIDKHRQNAHSGALLKVAREGKSHWQTQSRQENAHARRKHAVIITRRCA